jgi:hypothetical protein
MTSAKLKDFLITTKSLAICGYKSTVDWMVATSFELILLDLMQYNKITGQGLRSISKNAKEWAGNKNFKKLDFQIVTDQIYKVPWSNCPSIGYARYKAKCLKCPHRSKCPKAKPLKYKRA